MPATEKTAIDMTEIDKVKRKIQTLYRTNPFIHVDVSINRPKVLVNRQKAKIVGVYPHIFQLEADGKRYSLQYIDVVIKSIRILELE